MLDVTGGGPRFHWKLSHFLTVTALVTGFSIASSAWSSTEPTIPGSDIHSSAVGDYLSASFANRNHRTVDASRFFTEALGKSPGNLVLLQQAYASFLKAGDVRRAVDLAKAHPMDETQTISVNMLLVMDAVSQNNYAEADRILNQKTVDTLVGVDKILYPFIQFWVMIGKGEQNEAFNRSEIILNQDMFPTLFRDYQLALAYDVAGETEKAEVYYQRSIIAPVIPYHFAKAAGNFFERSGQPEQAKALYTRYNSQITQDSGSPELKKGRAKPAAFIASAKQGVAEVLREGVRALFKGGLYEEALPYLQLVMFLDGGHDETKMLLSEYYEAIQDYSRSVGLLRSIPESSDFYWQGQINLAKALFHLGKTREAGKLFLDISMKKKMDYTALFVWADLLRQEENWEDAIRIYNQVFQRVGDAGPYLWSIHFARGISYERMGQWDLAEKDLLKGLELQPDQPELLNYLGYSWVDRGVHIKEAKEMLEKAVAAKPHDAQVVDSMGWALYKLNEVDKAAQYLEKAVETTPYSTVINDHLGDIYWAQGRQREARFQWERALRYIDEKETVDKEFIKGKIANGLPEVPPSPSGLIKK